MLSNTDIGLRIYEARLEKGVTLDEIASRIGVAVSTVQRYEKGKISSIKLPVIQAIARELDVNPEWLVGKSEAKEIKAFVSSAPAYDFSNTEIQIVTSYRKADPAIQQAVRKLLDVPEEAGRGAASGE